MKRHFREFIAFLTVLLALCSFVEVFADTPTPGQKLFEGKCAQCHGKDAKGVAKMAKLFKLDPSKLDLTQGEAVTLTSDDITNTVTNGKNKMPKFKGKLTDDQIASVAKYLKSIQGSAASK